MKTVPIFLASNDNYASFVATTVASICYSTKSFIDFYILDSGISNFNKKNIELLKDRFDNFSIEYIKIDLEKFNGFSSHEYISLDTYSRILIPELKPELDKVIYLDVDIIAMGDIKKLYDEDLDGYVVGAIPEYFQKYVRNNMELDLSSNPASITFNAGVLLIDTKKWREQNITEELLKIREAYQHKILFADQDILNKCFDNNYKKLNVKYNLLSQMYFSKVLSDVEKKEVEEARIDTIIRHFEGPVKPWQYNRTWDNHKTENFNEFWFFAKMTTFYDGLSHSYISSNSSSTCEVVNDNIRKTVKVKFLYFIPLFKIKFNHKTIRVRLFNLIQILKFNK